MLLATNMRLDPIREALGAINRDQGTSPGHHDPNDQPDEPNSTA